MGYELNLSRNPTPPSRIQAGAAEQERQPLAFTSLWARVCPHMYTDLFEEWEVLPKLSSLAVKQS